MYIFCVKYLTTIKFRTVSSIKFAVSSYALQKHFISQSHDNKCTSFNLLRTDFWPHNLDMKITWDKKTVL